ncbi:MAG: protein kinase [Acidobacteriota bacterium]
MSHEPRWLLRSDVEILSASELAVGSREGYVVVRPRSRYGPTRVDLEGARLLERFRAPVSIAQALQKEAAASGGDVGEFVDRASALLQHLVAKEVLVSEATAATLPSSPLLQPGDRVAESTVLCPVAVADDGEVHRVRLDGGELAALKLQRKPAGSLDREAQILVRLGGGVSPALLYRGETGSASWLLLEWRPGIDPVAAAESWRGPGDRQRLLHLCLAVARAYAGLHALDVVHGDVHRRNVLVGPEDEVTLLDFGLARTRGDAGPPRAGVPFFFEPEYARSELADEPAPPASPRGEQYAVAVLLYWMVTGFPYIDFQLERRRLLEQIVSQDPLSFGERGVPAWPQLEEILRRSLAKEPVDRFPSLEALASAIENLLKEVGSGPRP